MSDFNTAFALLRLSKLTRTWISNGISKPIETVSLTYSLNKLEIVFFTRILIFMKRLQHIFCNAKEKENLMKLCGSDRKSPVWRVLCLESI